MLEQLVVDAWRKIKVHIVCINIEKASDLLTYEQLPFELSKVGIGEKHFLRGFQVFLTGRFFNVIVGKVRSAYTAGNSGVNQGTPLVPLLFTLFIIKVSVGYSTSPT